MNADDVSMEQALRDSQEKRELMHIAAQRVIDDHKAGRRNDPYALKWARSVVRKFAPLGRLLPPGTPVARAFCPAASSEETKP